MYIYIYICIYIYIYIYIYVYIYIYIYNIYRVVVTVISDLGDQRSHISHSRELRKYRLLDGFTGHLFLYCFPGV